MEPGERSESPATAPEAYRVRPGEAGDWAYVASSWRRNYVDRVDDQERVWWQSAAIEACLRSSSVLVAHPPERPEQILGWCCFRRPATVHYVFVKPYYRRHGIGRSLLEIALDIYGVQLPAAVSTTHRWVKAHAEGIGAIAAGWRRGGGLIEYNPALIFGGKP